MPEDTPNGLPLNKLSHNNSFQLYNAHSNCKLTMHKPFPSAQQVSKLTTASLSQVPLFLTADVLRMEQSFPMLSSVDNGCGRMQLVPQPPTLLASLRPSPSPEMVKPPKHLTLTGSNKLLVHQQEPTVPPHTWPNIHWLQWCPASTQLLLPQMKIQDLKRTHAHHLLPLLPPLQTGSPSLPHCVTLFQPSPTLV